MKKTPPVDPFDPKRLLGAIFEIQPSSARVGLQHPDSEVEVGRFVVVECEDSVLFGRLTGVHSSRQSVNGAGHEGGGHPTATIELLTSIDLDGGNAMRGIDHYPRLGNRVFTAPPALLRWLYECGQVRKTARGELEPVMFNLMLLKDGTQVGLSPERAFGRHCAVVGATGVGKSWTLAKLIEESSRFSAKLILFDSTGEFHTLRSGVHHVHIGVDQSGQDQSEEVVLPFFALTEADLFALFKPTGPTQGPKLRSAIKSLKLARVPHLATGGVVMKAGKLKYPFETAYAARAHEIEDPRANFDITKLPAQIDAECVFPTGGFASSPDASRWGAPNEVERSNCVNLITRIEDMLHAPELACVFQPGKTTPVFDRIDAFLADPEARVLRVSLKHLPFSHDAREIVANAIGRYTLDLARHGKIGERPLLLMLDEAHHFLNQTLEEDHARYALDSFELIAKEGRKLSLNFCLATQRPRDIPEGILSQIGTFIIHRLNNHMDRVAVESASSDADRSAMAFIPGLGEGEAIIIGADLPISLPVQIIAPANPPDSRGPDYQTQWR